MRCPHCKSNNVIEHYGPGLSWVECLKCGFCGSIPQFEEVLK
jgi:Zn ribbon nucleic-acid-binding protein